MTNVSHTSELAKEKLPKYIETELGKEKLCKHCGEYWPIDSEFWFMIKEKLNDETLKHRPDSACKGCYDMVYRPHKRKGTYKVKSQHEKVAA